MLMLLYFLFGPLLMLVAFIVADAAAYERPRRRPGEPPGAAGSLGMFGAGVTFVGFMASLS